MRGWILIFAIVCLALLVGWIALAQRLDRYVRSVLRGTWDAWFLWMIAKAISRFFHRVRYEGVENVPENEPVVFVVNHTAGVDPVLIQ